MSGGTKRKSTETAAKTTLKPRGRGGEIDDKCAFREEIDLASVRADAATDLSRGQILDVVLHHEGEYETAVCRARSPRRIVGTLASILGLDRLIACMREGHRYEARILLIRGTYCRVLVDRVPK
jgi:hypothetical protein